MNLKIYIVPVLVFAACGPAHVKMSLLKPNLSTVNKRADKLQVPVDIILDPKKISDRFLTNSFAIPPVRYDIEEVRSFASVHLVNVFKRWFQEVNVVSPTDPPRNGPRLLVSVGIERISIADGRIPAMHDPPGEAIVSMDWDLKVRRPGVETPVFEFNDRVSGRSFRSAKDAVASLLDAAIQRLSNVANGGMADIAGGFGSLQQLTYEDKACNFTFSIPAGWKKLGDSDSPVFTQVDGGRSCSFVVNVNQLRADFPVDAAIKNAAGTPLLKSPIKPVQFTGVENGKKVLFARGYVMVQEDRGTKRIIQQLYDRHHRAISLMASVRIEDSEACQPAFKSIYDSLRFGEAP